jgi:hypothetical protein
MCCYKIPLGGCFEYSAKHFFMYVSCSIVSIIETIVVFSNQISARIILEPTYNEMTFPLGEFKMSTK